MIKFADIEEDLNKKIHELLPTGIFPGEEKGVTLIKGIFNLPIQAEFSGNIIIGGPSVPMIAVVGNQSGRIYYFSLKMLLPDKEI